MSILNIYFFKVISLQLIKINEKEMYKKFFKNKHIFFFLPHKWDLCVLYTLFCDLFHHLSMSVNKDQFNLF